MMRRAKRSQSHACPEHGYGFFLQIRSVKPKIHAQPACPRGRHMVVGGYVPCTHVRIRLSQSSIDFKFKNERDQSFSSLERTRKRGEERERGSVMHLRRGGGGLSTDCSARHVAS